jgi:hypothetical protein
MSYQLKYLCFFICKGFLTITRDGFLQVHTYLKTVWRMCTLILWSLKIKKVKGVQQFIFHILFLNVQILYLMNSQHFMRPSLDGTYYGIEFSVHPSICLSGLCRQDRDWNISSQWGSYNLLYLITIMRERTTLVRDQRPRL